MIVVSWTIPIGRKGCPNHAGRPEYSRKEVRQIATYLRASNNLKHLQTLLVMLRSIKTFLRGDDLGIKTEDFEIDLCLVNETGPINLCFRQKVRNV
jgi:hypothetical protein